jgi:Kef-type K+ transport system membrane component KefB
MAYLADKYADPHDENDLLSALIAIQVLVWLFIIVPILILSLIDVLHNHKEDKLNPVLKAFAHMVSFSLGMTAYIIGLSMLLWIGYNLLIERQPEFHTGGSIGIIIIMVVFGLGLIKQVFIKTKQKRQGDLE